jgi:hypothetical protein
MLVLPEGLCYGRVDTADSADIIRRYLEGRVDNTFLRGRTSLPHPVQAAQYFAREEYGDDRIASFSPLTVDKAEGAIRVVLRGDTGPVTVDLTEEMSEPLLSQCHATVTGRVRMFRLKAIHNETVP